MRSKTPYLNNRHNHYLHLQHHPHRHDFLSFYFSIQHPYSVTKTMKSTNKQNNLQLNSNPRTVQTQLAMQISIVSRRKRLQRFLGSPRKLPAIFRRRSIGKSRKPSSSTSDRSSSNHNVRSLYTNIETSVVHEQAKPCTYCSCLPLKKRCKNGYPSSMCFTMRLQPISLQHYQCCCLTENAETYKNQGPPSCN